PEMGDRDRTGRRRVGRYERGRATRSQAPPGPRPPRPLNTEPQSRTARELRKRLDTTGAQPLLLYTGRAQVALRDVEGGLPAFVVRRLSCSRLARVCEPSTRPLPLPFCPGRPSFRCR